MAIDFKERQKKMPLAELKEKISHFLYRQFIDFERDKLIEVNSHEARPSFYLNKQAIIIDCVKSATPGNPEYEAMLKDYSGDEFKILILDLSQLDRKEVDDFLKEKLPALGCKL
ncbi:MAG TPA: hypothetical protein VJ461_00670 [Candidatus Nanoarchaeia archaeon]|nr:hypothetical protein [Candidatus Nanoarchaeia archaeon]